MKTKRQPNLTFWQIWNMSFGFLGIQYGFGLQQANMSPIFRYLGADEANLPILWLAGPMTGLIVQPIIGALSDRTWTRWGRRRPYFLAGALVGSAAVLAMPYSPALWVAAGLMWILDGAMNMAMEPYRAFVGDKLNPGQRTLGFAVQSFMIAGGQIAANLMPFLLAFFGLAMVAAEGRVPDFVKYAFVIGVVAMLVTVLWTVATTSEDSPEDLAAFRAQQAAQGGALGRIGHAFREIFAAVREMPREVRQLWWVKLFTWYGMPLMWQYLSLSIARHSFGARTAEALGFAEGTAMGGIGLLIMNVATLLVSFLIPGLVRRFGTRATYAACLAVGGLGFVLMLATDRLSFVLACMALVGIAWAAIITLPFVIATLVVPPARNGVYMGLLNAFICIPQLLSMLTVPLFYKTLLGEDPRNALVLLGLCLFIAAVFCFRISKTVDESVAEEPSDDGAAPA